MLTDVTVNVPPRDMSLAPDGLEALCEGDEDDGDDAGNPLPPENRPVTVTWCPTCSARLTPESAINLSSLVLAEERPALLDDPVDDGLLDDGLPAGGVPACAPSLLGFLVLLEPAFDPLLNFAFFNTKFPPALLELALLDELALGSLLDGPPPRCRHPVALAESADAPVDGCGVDVVGVCAANVAHSTTAVLSVTAHCPRCVFFITSLLLASVRPRVPCGWSRALPRGADVQGTIHPCDGARRGLVLALVSDISRRAIGRRRRRQPPGDSRNFGTSGVRGGAPRRRPTMSTPMRTSGASKTNSRVRDDPGRTVAELGTRLTPVQLMERAKETIRKATAERAREVAQSAGEMASEFAQGTRDVAADATDRVRAHPKVSSPRQQVSR